MGGPSERTARFFCLKGALGPLLGLLGPGDPAPHRPESAPPAPLSGPESPAQRPVIVDFIMRFCIVTLLP